MKILLVNTFDTWGGPGKWAYRMHRHFLSVGINSVYLVDQKISNDKSVVGHSGRLASLRSRIKQAIDYLPLLLYPRWKRVIFSVGWAPFGIEKAIEKFKPDVVHFNWVNRGFISVRSMSKIKVPIVWTMHDMWLFTGGCHYDEGCGRYQEHCGRCPLLGSRNDNDLSAQILKAKKEQWQHLNLTVVAPSRWLWQCAQKSSLFKGKNIINIPVSIDVNNFVATNKRKAREELGLPLDKKLVLFGAVNSTQDKRKGFEYLLQSLQILVGEVIGRELELVVFGSSGSHGMSEVKSKAHFVGTIKDSKKMPLLYAAADVFVAPSLQDNMPVTVMESLACGTPVVAFNIGGMPDMIDHKKNGYLASPRSAADLANGIQWALTEGPKDANFFKSCRQKILNEFNSATIAQKYLDLYKEILAS